jgi:serine/threonine-protein kinase RsbW
MTALHTPRRSEASDRKPERWSFWESVSALPQAVGVVSFVAEAMSRAGYSDKDVYGMRLALEEAVVNAVRHGNRCDPTKWVTVRYTVGPERVLVEVHDEGDGFDPDSVPDPTTLANRERPGGRGLLLMRSYATSMRYNAAGHCVTLCRRRSGTVAHSGQSLPGTPVAVATSRDM